MTIGAYVVPSFEVPKGWIRNSRIKIAQVTPIIVPVEMFGATTFKPLKICIRTRESVSH